MRVRAKKEPEGSQRQHEAPARGTNDLSVISSDMSIRGECETPGQLRIDGRVDGNIAAGAVELSPSGQVDGDLLANEGNRNGAAFVIGGKVAGTVRAGRVEVRQGGSVSGGVVADEAIIQGRVHGGVQARTRLALDATAEVEGDVLARRLALEEGGRVNGNIRMGEELTIDERSRSVRST